MAVTAQQVSQEAQWLSDRLSVQVRWVAVGILAFVWGLIISPPKELALSPRLLLWAGLLAILALLGDLLQYIFGYIYTMRVLRRIEKGTDQAYNRRHPLYRLRNYCFVAKQITVLAAAVVLVMAVLPPLLAG
jgi:membrane protein YqaA with SNARE-associated domain